MDKHLIDFKKIVPDGDQFYTSVYVMRAVHNNAGTSKNYVLNNAGIVKEKLNDKVFDFLREDIDFIKFENSFTI